MERKLHEQDPLGTRIDALRARAASLIAWVQAHLTRSYYEAQIQLKRRQWPWHLRVPNVPFLKNRQNRFFDAMFGMLAEVAGADGSINSDEREAVQNFATDNLRLSALQVITALKFFRETRESSRSFDSRANDLADMFRLRPELRRNVIDAMIDMAYSDSTMNVHEDRIIRRAVSILRLSAKDYEELKEEHAAEEALRNKLFDVEDRIGAEGPGRQSNRKARANAAEELLFSSGPYDVLGCSPSDTSTQIKRRYRKLVLQYHPDRMAAQGLPEEFRETAKKKFQEIQEAYEAIEMERGFT